MNCYMVVTGDYSDYKVVCVFDNKGNAEVAAKRLGTWYSVEEIPFNELPKNAAPAGYKYWSIWMNKTGIASRSHCYGTLVDGGEEFRIIKTVNNSELGLSCMVLAHDEDHAIKIANEKRTKLISMDLWKEGYEE